MIIKAYVGDCGNCQYLHMDKEGVFDLSPDHDGSTLGFVSLIPPSMTCDRTGGTPMLGRACKHFSMGCPPSILFYPERIVEVHDMVRSKDTAPYWEAWVALFTKANEVKEMQRSE